VAPTVSRQLSTRCVVATALVLSVADLTGCKANAADDPNLNPAKPTASASSGPRLVHDAIAIQHQANFKSTACAPDQISFYKSDPDGANAAEGCRTFKKVMHSTDPEALYVYAATDDFETGKWLWNMVRGEDLNETVNIISTTTGKQIYTNTDGP
jgi:hypothetical protein